MRLLSRTASLRIRRSRKMRRCVVQKFSFLSFVISCVRPDIAIQCVYPSGYSDNTPSVIAEASDET